MDIEKLNRSQIVLLTLLVSFVTSIATGIVTVSLMDQAPPAISQTVNRIVERTVEKVVPTTEGQAAASGVTTEKTIIVKEADLIVEAVEKVRPSLVGMQTETAEPVFLGLGLVLDNTGTIIVDLAALGGAERVEIVRADGAVAKADLVSRNEADGTATLRALATALDGKEIAWTPATLAADLPVLGQTVIALSGKTIPRIADGLVVALIPREGSDAIIDTNISPELLMGCSPLINTDGAVIGVSTVVSRASSQKGFIASTALTKPKTEAPSE